MKISVTGEWSRAGPAFTDRNEHSVESLTEYSIDAGSSYQFLQKWTN